MKNILSFLIALIWTFGAIAQSGSKNFIDQNYIQVTGIAEKEVVPNEIYLQVFINEKDNKGKESIQQLEAKMIQELEALDLDVEKQLSIKDLSSNFQFYFLLKTDVFTAKEYEILVYDAGTAGRVIERLSTTGISNIKLNRIDHSEVEKLNLEVKQEAVKNAKIKAEALAKSLDQKIGKAIFIQELDSPDISNLLQGKVSGVVIAGASAIYGSRSAQPNIDFEKVKMESKIEVRFVLE